MAKLRNLLKRLVFHKTPLRIRIARKVLRGMLTFHEKLELAAFPSPASGYTHYGFCIRQAMNLADSLGYPRISILEFGIAEGNGLVAVEQFVSELSKEFQVKVEIYGFGLEDGLPPPDDYRDSPYKWGEGHYPTNVHQLRQVLKTAKLILGDVRDTCPSFTSEYNPAPIGCVLVDLDYYSSTMGALTIFDSAPEFYLPRVVCYFDDVQHAYIGELKAIEDFNTAHPDKKIAQVRGGSIAGYWVRRLFELHDFSHPRYCDPTYPKSKYYWE